MSVLLTALLTFAVFAAGMVFPADAFAWGPGVHMVTGNWILQNLAVLPPLVAEPLMRHPGQFLHGCLAPDIFIGKGSVATEKHSHRWHNAFALLMRAATLSMRAYAYGYLAHLAADTVAHNVFVPLRMGAFPGSGRFSHVYLEAHADSLLAWDSRDAVSVFHEQGSKKNAALLRAAQHHAALPFAIKKHIFEGSVMLGGSSVWRTSLRAADGVLDTFLRVRGAARKGPEAQDGLLERLLPLATRAVADTLRNGEASAVSRLDPIGEQALAGAKRRGKGVSVRRKQAMTRTGDGMADDRQTPLQELPAHALGVLESLPAVCVSNGPVSP